MIEVSPNKRAHLRGMAHRLRDLADEIATRYGCDDHLHPATTGREFRDSRDFVEGARPVVEQADDDGDYQGDASVRMVSPLLPVHSDGDVDNGLAAGVSTRKRRADFLPALSAR